MPTKKKEITNFKDNLNKKNLNPFTIAIFILLGWAMLSFLISPSQYVKPEKIPINEVYTLIKEDKVKRVEIKDTDLKVELKDGGIVYTVKEPQVSLTEMLVMQNIDMNKVSDGIYEEKGIDWIVIANILFPIATIGFLWWIFRSAGKSAGGGVFGLGKSKAKLFSKNDKNRIGFNDVAGAKEIKEELFEIVDFLKNPEKYRKLGARIPKGVLLIGPSGVGKTLLARAIAGEANVPFYSVAGSEFIEMIVGVGSARVRDLFMIAKENSPSIIFIDEIDAIGRHRGKNVAVSNDEREQTLNQILVEMDGFDPRTSVIIIAATNRPDMLDTALIRPGRFDRHIKLNLPDVKEREDIMKIHMKGKPFAKDVSVEKLAKQTVGFSGADIENMLNEAAILAARMDSTEITMKELSEASTKVKLGPERKLLQSEEEKKIVAYHEAGHALVSAKNPNGDPVTRISIISRTMSLGHTEYLPKDNVYNLTRQKLLATIQNALGGRAAESLVFDQQTVGASSDIERATYLARKMVTDFGMSALGPINYVSDNIFWDGAEDKAVGYSQEVARKIDEEVSKIINTEYENALKTLKENREVLDKIAEELLIKETLEQEEFEKLISE